MGYRNCLTPEERHARERERNREYRQRHASQLRAANRAYRRTRHGLLVWMYCNARCRVTGRQQRVAHLYLGLPLLPREDFYRWAQASAEYERLYTGWVASGYDHTLTPSLDRIDTSQGYLVRNIRFVTANENRRQGRISRWGRRGLPRSHEAVRAAMVAVHTQV